MLKSKKFFTILTLIYVVYFISMIAYSIVVGTHENLDIVLSIPILIMILIIYIRHYWNGTSGITNTFRIMLMIKYIMVGINLIHCFSKLLLSFILLAKYNASMLLSDFLPYVLLDMVLLIGMFVVTSLLINRFNDRMYLEEGKTRIVSLIYGIMVFVFGLSYLLFQDHLYTSVLIVNAYNPSTLGNILYILKYLSYSGLFILYFFNNRLTD